MANIEQITINNWADFLELEPEFGGYVYRGQSNSNWDLETSLYRVIARSQTGYTNEGDFSDRLYAESASLKIFKARAHFYIDNLPQEQDAISWLSIMQHHGTPTRLLDFTESLYVAIYFALIDATGDSCVWAIHDQWLRENGTQLAKKEKISLKNEYREGQLDAIYDLSNFVINKSFNSNYEKDFKKPGILMIELKRQIPRLAVQQGIFLMPTSLRHTFMENLSSMKSPSEFPVITKIIIPQKLRVEFLMHLRVMNITSESLFPGIDGFARSLIHLEML